MIDLEAAEEQHILNPQVVQKDPGKIDLNAAQIQRIIVSGYPTQRARHFILTIKESAKDPGKSSPPAQELDEEAANARRWLAGAAQDVRLSSPNDAGAKGKRDESVSLNIGLTYRGLHRLGLAEKYLSVFDKKAPAFAEGAFPRAAHRLGDTGLSDADFWELPFKPNAAHVLVLLHAEEEKALNAISDQLRAYDTAGAFSGWDTPFDAAHITDDRKDRRAHFGLKDGITRALIEGIYDGKGHDVHKPGEFLLGYPNNDGFNPWFLARRPDEVANFFKNGSFGVFRKMEQDEVAFNSFVNVCSASLGQTREYVIAKLVGRWPDGQVLDINCHSKPPPVLTKDAHPDDTFDFSNDKDGIGCPFGSHIRRMNPRKDRVVPFRRRPLIRRGMPYGKAFAKGGEYDKRGLMGLFFCASIEDQFEHLVAEWGNKSPMGVNNRGDARDPLAGNHGSAPSVFDIPMREGPSRKLTGFGPFITTKGTIYAFFPSKRALLAIACNSAHTRSARNECPECDAALRAAQI